jgi:hypothetical protein
MADELRTLFDAFEADSLARTSPPGARVVQSTVRRRYAIRAIAFAVAALALLIAAVWSPLRASHPQPIGPTPTVSPTTTGSPDAVSVGGAVTPSPSASAGSPSPLSSDCDPSGVGKGGNYVGVELGGPAPDQYVLTPRMLAICPDLKIWLTQATYVGAGASSSTVTRTASTPVTLSASNPSVTFKAQLPPPSCQSVLIVTFVGYTGPPAVPSTLTNYVPTLVADGTTAQVAEDLLKQGLRLQAALWQAPAC